MRLLLIGPALLWFRSTWRQIPEPVEPLSHGGLWGKLVPFAMSVWAVNLLYNLVGVVDRYMIMHYAPDGRSAGAGGRLSQFASRADVDGLGERHRRRNLAAVFEPRLGSWLAAGRCGETESGDQAARRGDVRRSALVLLASPLLFGVAFHGKYDGGLADSSLDAHLLHLDGSGAAGADVFVVRRTGAAADAWRWWPA